MKDADRRAVLTHYNWKVRRFIQCGSTLVLTMWPISRCCAVVGSVVWIMGDFSAFQKNTSIFYQFSTEVLRIYGLYHLFFLVLLLSDSSVKNSSATQIKPFSFIPHLCYLKMEPIPASMGREVRYTLDRSPANHRASIPTTQPHRARLTHFSHDLLVNSGELAPEFPRSLPFTHEQLSGRFSAQTRSHRQQILRIIQARGGAAGCSRQRQPPVSALITANSPDIFVCVFYRYDTALHREILVLVVIFCICRARWIQQRIPCCVHVVGGPVEKVHRNCRTVHSHMHVLQGEYRGSHRAVLWDNAHKHGEKVQTPHRKSSAQTARHLLVWGGCRNQVYYGIEEYLQLY